MRAFLACSAALSWLKESKFHYSSHIITTITFPFARVLHRDLNRSLMTNADC